MDVFEQHHWAVRLRVISIRGTIEQHHEIQWRHAEMGDTEGIEEIAARITALKQQLVFAEAIKIAVNSCAARRRGRTEIAA